MIFSKKVRSQLLGTLKILLTLLISSNCFSQDVNFRSTRFEDAIRIAKAEEKFILVDVYATWCVPCKWMDSNVLNNPSVISLIRAQFVPLKIQGDSTTNDDVSTRKNFHLNQELLRKYKVRGYPTYLVFNSEGQLVNKAIGQKFLPDFIRFLTNSLRDDKQFYTLIRRSYQYDSDKKTLRVLIKDAEALSEKGIADSLAHIYIDQFVVKEISASGFTKDNLSFLQSYTKKLNEPGAKYFLDSAAKIDMVIGKVGYAEAVVKELTTKSIITPFLESRAADVMLISDWKSLANKIQSQTNLKDPDIVLLPAKVSYHLNRNEFNTAIKIYFEKLRKFGIGKTEMERAVDNNDFFWSNVVRKSDNLEYLNMSSEWMRRVIEADNFKYPASIDTYANLLYKAGKRAVAIRWQTIAVEKENQNCLELSKRLKKEIRPDSSYLITLNKMKRGERLQYE